MPQLHAEVMTWISKQLHQKNCAHPLVVGVSAPQGAGKTTLTTKIIQQLHEVRAVAVSIDDFYLTHEEQLKVAKSHPNNPYLQQRGYPGTHDLELGVETLRKLIQIENEEVLIPRYDKSAFNGQGDRAPSRDWTKASGPLDLILFEGWMLAFDIPEYHPWWRFLNALIYLRAHDKEYVVEWRLEAEQKMRAIKKSGMTDEQIISYAKKFLPAYDRWADSVPETVKKLCLNPHHYLEIEIGKDRELMRIIHQ